MASNSKFIVERTVVASEDTTIGASYEDVTGLSFGVKAGQTYAFRAVVVYNAAATTDGSAWSVNGPSSPTDLAVRVSWSLTTTSASAATTNAYDTIAVNATSAATTDNVAVIEGVITPSADGDFAIRGIAENADTITVQGNLSTLSWKRIDWPTSA